MTDNTQTPRRNSSSTLNIGIGMLIGLLVALIVAYFSMSGGPFRDKANNNSLTPTNGSTDPNAPLYTNQQGSTGVAPVSPTLPSTDPAANEQGAGTGVLMGGAAASGSSPSKKPSSDSTDTTTADEAPTKPKKTDDPIGDLINNKAQPASNTETKPVEKAKPSTTNDSGKTSSTVAPKTASAVTPKAVTAVAPKTVKPATAPNNNTSPKIVKPVTAP